MQGFLPPSLPLFHSLPTLLSLTLSTLSYPPLPWSRIFLQGRRRKTRFGLGGFEEVKPLRSPPLHSSPLSSLASHSTHTHHHLCKFFQGGRRPSPGSRLQKTLPWSLSHSPRLLVVVHSPLYFSLTAALSLFSTCSFTLTCSLFQSSLAIVLLSQWLSLNDSCTFCVGLSGCKCPRASVHPYPTHRDCFYLSLENTRSLA